MYPQVFEISSLEGHTAAVTSVLVVPASSPASKVLCFCWTASLDGTIRYWDFLAPELMKTVEVKMPIYSMVIPSLLVQSDKDKENESPLFAYISVENSNVQEKKVNTLCGQIKKFNLTKSRMVGGVVLRETPQPEFLTVSPSGSYFGMHNKRTIHIWKVPRSDSDRAVAKKISLHHTKSVTAKGGGLGFIQANNQTKNIFKAGKPSSQELLVYVDGDHEFVVFDPQSSETHELSLTGQQNLATNEETVEQLGYASVYGELPEFELKSKDDELWEATAPSRPSERPWESIFSGSSHDLPPLTKLCSPFLESLLERRTTTSTTAIVE
ncbi:hypothetical protein G4B88_016498 [Cannabis sativa]|uniref:Uncharacterized protein n=1 Tax=Cannabis sativa TaxID=3483 RepID=A0A7J6H9C4_CANSA|nr:hypothetical protein G4B88_016498 [Cannabis sativa]